MKKLLFAFCLLGFFATLSASSKPKLIWFDATANFRRLSSSDSICYYLDKVKQAGFTDVVIDVKPITGEVLYPSKIAPQMKEWHGFTRPDSLDFLNVFINESHKRDLKIHASLNTFSGGHNYIDRGLVYKDKSDWQSVNYTDSGFVPITKQKHKYSAMLNPANKEIQDYEIAILKELVTNYPQLDGLILDRVRYDGIEADFSELSKQLFEKYISDKVENFPEDIFAWSKDAKGNVVKIEGKYYKQWLEWRVSVIYNYIAEARKEVKKINPKISFGDYTGAWYPTYYEVGVNWASSKYDPSKDYDWATAKYKDFGYSELLDLYTTGCYFFEVTKEEVERNNADTVNRTEAGLSKGKEYWYSVEGSAELVNKVVMKAVPVYGGLYVEQYKEKNSPEQFVKAVEMCLKKTDGLMIFDIVQLIEYDWWNAMGKGIKAGEKY